MMWQARLTMIQARRQKREEAKARGETIEPVEAQNDGSLAMDRWEHREGSLIASGATLVTDGGGTHSDVLHGCALTASNAGCAGCRGISLHTGRSTSLSIHLQQPPCAAPCPPTLPDPPL